MTVETLFIDWTEAARVSGAPSAEAARRWVIRWNRRRPDLAVVRRRGRVEVRSFKDALKADAAEFSSGSRQVTKAAVAALRARGGRHA